MDDKIERFYVFNEIDPETGELVYLYAIAHKVDGRLVYVITEDKAEAAADLKAFCSQRGYLTADEVREDEDYGVKTVEQMREIFANGNKNSPVNDPNFNFLEAIRKPEVKKSDELNHTSRIRRIFGAVQKQFKKTHVKLATLGAVCLTIFGIVASAKAKSNSDVEGKQVAFSSAVPETTANPSEEGTVTEVEYDFDQDTASYEELIDHTTNVTKKTFMTKFHDAIHFFNGTFANNHKDQDKTTKLCLSVEELQSWYMAMNGKELTLDEITSIFDKTDLDKEESIESYKSSLLQMFLAAVVQTEPTKLENLIEDEAGKEFYLKYENININSNKEEDLGKLKQIYTDFFAMASKDFMVEDGDHVEHLTLSQMGIKNYYSSVLPIISAMNEKIQSYGLTVGFSKEELANIDAQVDRIHDVIICDLPYQNIRDVADRLQTYQISHQDQEYSDPTYVNFMRAIRESLEKEDNYHLEDRDISTLDIFAKRMHSTLNEEIVVDEGSYSTSTEQKVVSRRSETTTTSATDTKTTNISRDEAVSAVGEDAVKEAERKADREAGIPQANEQAKKDAEKAADEEAKRQQAIEDQKGQEIDNQIRDEQENINQSIDNINGAINNGQPIPSAPGIDLGDHGGASDITKDPSGAVSPSESLPDPDETGKEFDNPASDSDLSGVIIEEEVDVEPYQTAPVDQATLIDQVIDQMEAGNEVSINPDEGIVEVVVTEQEGSNVLTR